MIASKSVAHYFWYQQTVGLDTPTSTGLLRCDTNRFYDGRFIVTVFDTVDGPDKALLVKIPHSPNKKQVFNVYYDVVNKYASTVGLELQIIA